MAQIATFSDLLLYSCEKFGDRIGFRYYNPKCEDKKEVSYNQFLSRIKSLIGELDAKGVPQNAHVGVVCENSIDYAAALFALPSRGNVIVPIDSKMQADKIQERFRFADCSYAFTSSTLEERVCGLKDYSVFERIKSKEGNLRKPKEEDLAMLIYSSGTTSSNTMFKASMLTHRNYISNIKVIPKALNFTYQDNVLMALPLHHIFGIVVSIFPSYLGGITTITERGPNTAQVARESQVSIIPSAPEILRIMDRRLERELEGLKARAAKVFLGEEELKKRIRKGISPKLRFLISGSDKLPIQTATSLYDKGVEVLEGIGLTECLIILVNREGDNKFGTVGKPLCGIEIIVDNPDAGGIGEMLIRGPNVMQGYYKNLDATKATLKDGLLYTGDLIKKHDSGHIEIVGRKKEMIKVHGEAVNIAELRAKILGSCPLVDQVHIYLDSKSEKLIAQVVPRWEEGKEDAIRQKVTQQVAIAESNFPSYAYFARLEIKKDRFPVTSTGKMMVS